MLVYQISLSKLCAIIDGSSLSYAWRSVWEGHPMMRSYSLTSKATRKRQAVSRDWGLKASGLGRSEITFHSLRHCHASQLIDAGVDIVTISKRLGHASPDVTLRVYAHLFRRDDGKAAAAINAALAGATSS